VSNERDLVLWFEDVGIEDVGLVGGKTASLGEMINELGKKGVKVPGGFAITAEVPSNVIVADEFAEIFDGFSIGSNDLTQLALGLDRDSELVSHIYDERETTVKKLLSQVISAAKKKNKKIGICGQAPSDYPEIARFLVECGIDSLSLNPDTVLQVKLEVSKLEKKLGVAPK